MVASNAQRQAAWRARHPTAAKQTNARDARTYRKAATLARPFAGVDGEGGTVNGRHAYTLLRAGDHRLHTGKPLTAAQCLGFLADLERGPIYVGFAFNYDVTMILQGLPFERIRRLRNRAGRMTPKGGMMPVEWGGFKFDYLPGKYFKVKREHDPRPYVVINDVFSFFQCSFMRAITDWDIGTAEQRELIAEGKAKRSEFTELTLGADRYNALEIDLLQQLMTAFRDVCDGTGYLPAQWQGPGWLAASMMKRHGIVRTKDLSIPHDIARTCQDAFYGGRFEIGAVGPVGPCYEHDIVSAYPDALRRLPCLIHGKFIRTDSPTGLWVGRGLFKARESAHFYGYPVRRRDGSILFPAHGDGTYWSVEVEAAIHQDFSPDADVWQYVTDCDCEPFGFIPDVFAERRKLGKSAKGKVLKLSLNSLYGKSCQSVGKAPYANPIYASLITALTRAKLSALVHAGPLCCWDAYMLATDAVYTREPRPQPQTGELGSWETATLPDLFLIQPGLYFTGAKPPKTRGIPNSLVVENEALFRDTFAVGHAEGLRGSQMKVSIDVKTFYGLGVAVARNKPDLAGRWEVLPREVSFDWHTKRGQATPLDGHYHLDPYWCSDGPNIPYSKDIGRMRDSFREQYDDWTDQPEWAQQFWDVAQ